jgi:hypothetical protein
VSPWRRLFTPAAAAGFFLLVLGAVGCIWRTHVADRRGAPDGASWDDLALWLLMLALGAYLIAARLTREFVQDVAPNLSRFGFGRRAADADAARLAAEQAARDAAVRDAAAQEFARTRGAGPTDPRTDRWLDAEGEAVRDGVRREGGAVRGDDERAALRAWLDATAPQPGQTARIARAVAAALDARDARAAAAELPVERRDPETPA